MIEPLRTSVDLACSAEDAFATWTERFGTWWPRSHTVSGSADADVRFEPRPGGRIYERLGDGTEHDWGRVVGWDPPRRLAYSWHLRRDRADATDVELTFVDLAPDRCRLEIEHTGWERLGADGPAWRDANRGGWSGLLPHFGAACEPHGRTAPRGGTS